MKQVTTINSDMVGLIIRKIKVIPTKEMGEYSVTITLKNISDEGLEVFGIDEEPEQTVVIINQTKEGGK